MTDRLLTAEEVGEMLSVMSANAEPLVDDRDFRLYRGDALEVLANLPDEHADAVVTSPPYLDARPEYPSPTLDEFEGIFRELRRALHSEPTEAKPAWLSQATRGPAKHPA